MKPIAETPNFTLYRTDEGTSVIKVMFSEGVYKMDKGRYFLVDQALNSADVEHLRQIAAGIREDYPDATYPELDPSDLHIEK